MQHATRRILLASLLCWAFVAGAQDWHPNDKDFLFTSNRDGNSEIYLKKAGQTEWLNLSQHPASDNWPVWSPDGQKVVFQSKRSGNLDIWLMNADGSDPQQLTTDPEPDYLPAWSPDGSTILFTSWRKDSAADVRAPHIYAMAVDGNEQRRLVAQSLNTSEGATWSADSQWIVYSRKIGNGADLFLADRHGQQEKQLTFDAGQNIYNGASAISPDGKTIAFYSDNEKSAALSLIDIDGNNRRVLLATGHNWYPHWSADGQWLTYTAKVPGDAAGNIDIFAISLIPGSQPVLLIGGLSRDTEGSWR